MIGRRRRRRREESSWPLLRHVWVVPGPGRTWTIERGDPDLTLVNGLGHVIAKSGPLEHGQGFTIKAEAIKAAECVCDVLGGAELFIQKRNGEIQDRRTYPRAADPPGRG